MTLFISFSIASMVILWVGYLIKYKGKTNLIAGFDESYTGNKVKLGNRVGNGLFSIASMFFFIGLSSIYAAQYFQYIFIGVLLTVSAIIVIIASQSS